MVLSDGKKSGLLLLYVRLVSCKCVFPRPQTGPENAKIIENIRFNSYVTFWYTLWSIMANKNYVSSSYLAAWLLGSRCFLGPGQAPKVQKSLKKLVFTRI